MQKVLVLFAHPNYQKSRTNRRLIEALDGAENIRVHDLYEVYPDFHIDVEGEQALLRDHDLIVFHHPFYWYSAPALLKEWQELVLVHGFAYGPGGDALRGKRALSAITTGGSAEAYAPDGINSRPIPELLVPIAQTVRFCGMTYLPPFVVHGTHRLTGPETIAPHAEAYRTLLAAHSNERDRLSMIMEAELLHDLDEALRRPLLRDGIVVTLRDRDADADLESAQRGERRARRDLGSLRGEAGTQPPGLRGG